MNEKQQLFLQEYLRTGGKIKAYQTTYPKAKESAGQNTQSPINRPVINLKTDNKRQQIIKAVILSAAKNPPGPCK